MSGVQSAPGIDAESIENCQSCRAGKPMSFFRESWESGLAQGIALIATAVVGWLLEWPQRGWARVKSWRENRRDSRAAITDGLRKIGALADDVSRISYQISPNGGGSLRDAVDRSELAMNAARETLDGQDKVLASIKRDLGLNTAFARFQSDTSDELTFYASPDGQNDYASAAYQRFLGVGERELRGYGWKNYIAPEESALYLADQETCIRERRKFQRRVNMVRSDGVRALVDVTITMYPDDRDQGLQSLMGHIRPVPA